MERSGHFQRRNPSHSSPSSSSSTSYRQSAHSRSNRFAKSAPNSVGRRISGHQEPEAAKNEPSDPPAIAGTCPFMCPEEERAQRERLRDLAVFERLNGNPSLSSPSLAVKKVKFHVISHYKLRNHSSFQDASSLHYLNLEQLTKSLTSLFDLYEVNRSSNSACENEAEFRSFYVLLHLGSNSQLMGESLSLWFRHVPSSIMRSKEMCFARELLRFFRFGNYKRFLNAVAAEASCLQYCIIEPYVNEVRALALAFINNGGYKLHPYPLAHLSNLLMMKVSEVESFCNACGLETCTDEEGNKLLPMKQTTFCRPKGGFMRYGLMGLDQFEDQLLNCAAGEGE
ncbi:SAC3 family protein C isoform X3 [Morus notabilis]|uniref:SAC3 family protein C isoform X3 n=1 Tax=Morus notabilis TaxID=981085 RepID=UPI000CED1B3D|nr:SAC3 family protein C isoform X3 [Morus notabilis]